MYVNECAKLDLLEIGLQVLMQDRRMLQVNKAMAQSRMLQGLHTLFRSLCLYFNAVIVAFDTAVHCKQQP